MCRTLCAAVFGLSRPASRDADRLEVEREVIGESLEETRRKMRREEEGKRYQNVSPN